jgi:hypothetical protein
MMSIQIQRCFHDSWVRVDFIKSQVQCGILNALPEAVANNWMSQEHASFLTNLILKNISLLKGIRTLAFNSSVFGTGVADHETSISILVGNLLYKTVDINEIVWIYQAVETWLDEYGKS